MGMYDQFRLKRPTVKTCEADAWYQSKDMDCNLVDYEVDADGQLWEIGLCEVPAPWGKEKTNHTGTVRIGDTGIYDYALTFENGKLIAMQTIEPATKWDMLSIEHNARDKNSPHHSAAATMWTQFKRTSKPIPFDEYIAWRYPHGNFVDPVSAA
jgi:hypothetical protein